MVREFSEAEVEERLPMSVALEAVAAAMRALAAGQAVNQPRRRLSLPAAPGGPRSRAMLHAMEGAVYRNGRWYFGYKIYSTGSAGAHFTVGLYDGETGAPLARFAADRLGQRRTGAASALATQFLSPADADDVAVIGAGWQAESQLEGIAMVRPLRRIRVFSRRVENRNRFADKISQRLGIQVAPSQSAAAAVQGAAIIVTATTAPTPVLADADLAPGAHINAIGSNAAGRRELEAATVLRASRLVVDSREQCRQEAGDLLAAFADQDSGWDRVEELATVVAAGPRPRDPGALTLFKSTGMAIWDVACAAAIWEQAG